MVSTADEEDVRTVGTVRRRTPVEAANNIVVKRSTAAIARSRQEDAVAVAAGNQVAVYSILGSPSTCTIIYKFFPKYKLLFCKLLIDHIFLAKKQFHTI